MAVTIRTVEVPPGGGTVKIQIPDNEAGGDGPGKPRSAPAKGNPGSLADNSRKIFFFCFLLGILLLCGASILKKHSNRNRAARSKVEVVTSINPEQESPWIVDTKVNKVGKVVDTKVNKPGQYYYDGNEGIVYCYPTVQR